MGKLWRFIKTDLGKAAVALYVGAIVVGFAIYQAAPQINPEIWEAQNVDNFWLGTPEVKINNYYPGKVLETKLRFHNGSDEPVRFTVRFARANDLAKGYKQAPDGAAFWVKFEPILTLEPKQTVMLPASFVIPEGIKVDTERWEFWTIIKPDNTGFIQTELVTRWFVTMR